MLTSTAFFFLFRCALVYQREILVLFQGRCSHGGLGAAMMASSHSRFESCGT
jgi:hypothetical protein